MSNARQSARSTGQAPLGGAPLLILVAMVMAGSAHAIEPALCSVRSAAVEHRTARHWPGTLADAVRTAMSGSTARQALAGRLAVRRTPRPDEPSVIAAGVLPDAAAPAPRPLRAELLNLPPPRA